jgi:hypothetical protein
MRSVIIGLLLTFLLAGCTQAIPEQAESQHFKEWKDSSSIVENLPKSWKLTNLYLPIQNLYIHKKYRVVSNLEYANYYVEDTSKNINLVEFAYNDVDKKDFLNSSLLLENEDIKIDCRGDHDNEIHIKNKKTAKRAIIYSRVGYRDGSCRDEITLAYNANILIYTSIDSSLTKHSIKFYDLKRKKVFKSVPIPNIYKFKSIYLSVDGQYLFIKANSDDFYSINLYSISQTYAKYLSRELAKKDIREKNIFLESQKQYFTISQQFDLLYKYRYEEVKSKNSLKAYREFLSNARETQIKSSTANLRAKPSTKSAIVGKLKKGDRVEIIQREKSWSKIKYKDSYAWVYKSLLKSSYNPAFYKYKKMAMKEISRLTHNKMMKTKDLKSLENYIAKHPNAKEVKKRVISIYRKKHNTSSSLKAYRYSHSKNDIKNAKKYANSQKDRRILNRFYEKEAYKRVHNSLKDLVSFDKRYPNSSKRKSIHKKINTLLNKELNNNYNSIAELQQLLKRYPNYEGSHKIAQRIEKLQEKKREEIAYQKHCKQQYQLNDGSSVKWKGCSATLRKRWKTFFGYQCYIELHEYCSWGLSAAPRGQVRQVDMCELNW